MPLADENPPLADQVAQEVSSRLTNGMRARVAIVTIATVRARGQTTRGRPVNLEQLHTFIAIVETGSFTKAATRLFLSQAAVSSRIKALESDLRCSLFERDAHRVRLTQAGEQVLAFARSVVAAEGELRSAVAGSPPSHRTIRLGASPSSSTEIAQLILRSFARAHPETSVNLTVDDVLTLAEKLADDQIDAAVFEPCFEHEFLDYRIFGPDRVIVLAASTSPFVSLPQPLNLETLIQLPFVMRHPQCCTLRHMLARLRRATGRIDVALNVVCWVDDVEGVRTVVRSGSAVTAISEYAFIEDVIAGTMTPVEVAALDSSRIRVIATRTPGPNPEAQLLLAHLSRDDVRALFASPESVYRANRAETLHSMPDSDPHPTVL